MKRHLYDFIPGGLTQDQCERTKNGLDQMVCMMVDWFEDRARRCPDSLEGTIATYANLVAQNAHNAVWRTPMTEEPKVVSFPKAPKMRRDKTDADHVAAIRKTWRAFTRAVADARNFGLQVELGTNDIHVEPRLSRHYRGR